MAEQNRFQISLSILSGKSDLLVAMGVIGIIGVMIIPLPPVVLDILLSFDIALAVVILLSAMYTLDPLDFSVFPPLLLIATLFRLSLNIASTRLILLNGEKGIEAAGQVIKSFGSFVIGGNYVVGLLIFFILVLINFIVITKGAERTAEVSARFTLDAMPGKQMSIDADLNAGLIDDEQARQRRAKISQEAEFYGSMDGASKFVKGDAIAGIVITIINILGGLIIGMLQKGMTLNQAAATYTLLTVGDGLVSQIPALIVSTSSGIIVTRAISETHMGEEMTQQLLIHPKAIGLTSVILFCFGLVPGLPTVSFLGLSAVSGILAYTVYKIQTSSSEQREETAEAPQPSPVEEASKLFTLIEPLALEVGLRLIPLIDLKQQGDVLDRITAIRKQYASEMGFVFPPVRIRDNLQLEPHSYSILMKGVEMAQGTLMPDHCLAMSSNEHAAPVDGIPTKDPTFGLAALWISEKEAGQAKALGYTVVDLSTVIATHFKEVIHNYSYELLTRQEAQNMLDRLAEEHPKVVEELVPNLLSLGTIQKVLQNLLKEQVPIRDLVTIVETLGDHTASTKDPDLLTEYVRGKLSRTISDLYKDKNGNLPVFVLDQRIEETITKSIQHSDQGSFLALNPTTAQGIITQINQKVKTTETEHYPILLCSNNIRRYIRALIERFIPKLVILAYNEIAENVKIQSLGIVELVNAN